MITPESFSRTIADPTRLRILMLLLKEEELCVCHLTDILQMVQPKISRHLAVLRENKLLLDRRSGLWIYYRLHPDSPIWCYKTLQSLSTGCINIEPYINDQKRLVNLDSYSESKKMPNLAQ
ncbi:MAG: metalloregulator ArsR/SmtB family transcription factor [Cocleimonas sp.]|nr:metalloregulator ArsR/SmtB family transcription factor [Cocleimonas sp.]